MPEQPLTSKQLAALRHIRNRIVHGQEPPSVRELTQLLGYSSPNGAAYVLAQLMALRYIHRRKGGKLQLLRELPDEPSRARTVLVPVVGSAPCGGPLLAEENIEGYVPISIQLARPPHRYFLLHAVGDSMNEAGIQDGDLALVRQQATAENGDRVVALIDDQATIKVFRRSADAVALQPRSSTRTHRPIILTTDFQVQGVVQAAIPDWRKEK